MHALPITTPSVVRNARTLLAQRASSATIQVSLVTIMIAADDYNKPRRKTSRREFRCSIRIQESLAGANGSRLYGKHLEEHRPSDQPPPSISFPPASTPLPLPCYADRDPATRD